MQLSNKFLILSEETSQLRLLQRKGSCSLDGISTDVVGIILRHEC